MKISTLLKTSLAASLFYKSQDRLTQKPAVYAWGLNTSGQLGIGSETSQALPQILEQLSLDHPYSVFSSGHSHSSVAVTDSTLYTWGYGMDGVLGLTSTDTNVLIPTPVETLQRKKIKKVSLGSGHMLALTTQGKVYSWGLDDAGQCGVQTQKNDKNSKYYKPQAFKGGNLPTELQGFSGAVVDIGCGKFFSAAVTENGELFTWGQGRDYALGHLNREIVKQPKKVQSLQGIFIEKVACGRNFVLALSKEGEVYSWGNNDNGQLGISQMEKFKESPQKIRLLKNIVEIACGDFYSVALNSKGEVFSWGAGNDGQLSHKNTANQSTPKNIPDLPLVAKIACGGGHTAFLTQDFQLLLAGRGRDGQLGRQGHRESMASNRSSALIVDYFSGMRVLDVSCGAHHTLALAVNQRYEKVFEESLRGCFWFEFIGYLVGQEIWIEIQ